MKTIQVENNILLKQIQLSDAKDIFETIDAQRDYFGKWLPFVALTRVLKDTEKFIDAIVNAKPENFEYVFVIHFRGTLIGLIGFKSTDKQNRKTEIGYWLSEKHQKKGIVTKSVKKLCEFAFNELGINRIQIKCAVDNLPSKNIPQGLGFHLEGIERDGELLTGNIFTDLEVYSKLKNE